MSGPLRVLVADDELMARRRLQRLLRDLPGVEVCGECLDGAEVLRRVQGNDVDVLLLDIQMPGLSGVEAMRQLPSPRPYVIFCTAHAEHAVQAFDLGAVDYLLKPIEAGRLEKALDRARARAEQRAPGPGAAAEGARAEPRALERLPVETRQGIVLVDPAAISHAVLEGALVRIATADGELLTAARLQELEGRLPPRFMRVHRRALVNLDRIVRLEPSENGGFVARMAQGDAIQVSRQAARELRRMLGLRRAPEAGSGGEE